VGGEAVSLVGRTGPLSVLARTTGTHDMLRFQGAQAALPVQVGEAAFKGGGTVSTGPRGSLPRVEASF
jgi:hypothetical protein